MEKTFYCQSCNLPLIDIFETSESECYDVEVTCPHCGDILSETIFGKLKADGTDYTQIEKVEFNDDVYFVNLKVVKSW